MDGQAEWPIGDVRKQHVLEIYNSPHYRQLREKTATRAEASPCNQHFLVETGTRRSARRSRYVAYLGPPSEGLTQGATSKRRT